MTIARFPWQYDRCAEVVRQGKIALNIGSNTDPAGLSELGPLVEHVDMYEIDPNNGPILYNHLFNITEKWPLFSEYAGLALFGDILEHLEEHQILHALKEAHRVAEKLAITVPNDPRWETEGIGDGTGSYHCITVTEPKLRNWLSETGWHITDFQKIGKDMWWEAYFFVSAEKA